MDAAEACRAAIVRCDPQAWCYALAEHAIAVAPLRITQGRATRQLMRRSSCIARKGRFCYEAAKPSGNPAPACYGRIPPPLRDPLSRFLSRFDVLCPPVSALPAISHHRTIGIRWARTLAPAIEAHQQASHDLPDLEDGSPGRAGSGALGSPTAGIASGLAGSSRRASWLAVA